MLHIVIKTIPHKSQRYDTVGDWYEEKGKLIIAVSNMDDWKKEVLVAIHELVEVMLCKDRIITQSQVDDFDKEFEARRPKGNTDEPGDDPAAPYRREHFFATNIERLMSAELKVDWKEYNEKVNSL